MGTARLILVAFVALFLASGCTASTVDISGDFSTEEHDAILAGVATWPASVLEGRALYFVRGTEADMSACCPGNPIDAVPDAYTHKRTIHLLPMSESSVSPGKTPAETYRLIVAHEVGHAIGIRHHITDRPSVMQPVTGDVVDPTEEDVKVALLSGAGPGAQ